MNLNLLGHHSKVVYYFKWDKHLKIGIKSVLESPKQNQIEIVPKPEKSKQETGFSQYVSGKSNQLQVKKKTTQYCLTYFI